jgi:hypothetical protein
MNSIKIPNKNYLLKNSVIKQKLKFKTLIRKLESIKKDNQLLEIKLIDKNKFVVEMEKFYKDMISDTDSINLIQGYGYLAFIQWNQSTRKLNNSINDLTTENIIQKKFSRDYEFFHTVSDSLNFLCDEFEKLENS